MAIIRPLYLGISLAILTSAGSVVAQWSPKEAPVMTRWASTVTPAGVHQEYPRPQMVRKGWLNLNGLWEYAVRPRNGGPLPLRESR